MYEKWKKAFELSVAGTMLSLASLLAASVGYGEGWLFFTILSVIYIGRAWWIIIKE
jgi:hypothetical protein